MQLCKVRLPSGEERVGVVHEGRVLLLSFQQAAGMRTLSDLLHGADPAAVAEKMIDHSHPGLAWAEAHLLSPIDQQEVWAAGVTYKRSQEARERESAGAARFYDLVYTAPRPELFFKATARRVVGPGAAVHIRRDSRWSVPEPELALVISPDLRIVGYTIGNDMSSRDIEGENPLYLPQAKIYDGSCAIGPVVTLSAALPPPDETRIHMTIERGGSVVFEGTTMLSAMHRRLEDLVSWLARENSFPEGIILLTGTGIVPPDDFTLRDGDLVTIDVSGVGRLSNPVTQS
jgi:2-dehydro-3-deoxy-D-arabinonate dehydratase